MPGGGHVESLELCRQTARLVAGYRCTPYPYHTVHWLAMQLAHAVLISGFGASPRIWCWSLQISVTYAYLFIFYASRLIYYTPTLPFARGVTVLDVRVHPYI